MTAARTYTIGKATLELYEADVFSITADALVFGRTPELRARAEGLAGKRFERVLDRPLLTISWAAEMLRSDLLPWRSALSLRYRPRSKNPFGPFTPPHLPHVARLAITLRNAVFDLATREAAETIAILPLSCRNPEVVACATVSAARSLVRRRNALKIVTRDGIDVLRRWIEDSALLARANRSAAVPVWTDEQFVLRSPTVF